MKRSVHDAAVGARRGYGEKHQVDREQYESETRCLPPETTDCPGLARAAK